MLAKLSRCLTHRARLWRSRDALYYATLITDIRRWLRGADWTELRRQHRRVQPPTNIELRFREAQGEGT